MCVPKSFLALTILVCIISTALAQSPQEGTVLKWDTEPYSKTKTLVRNGVVYYIQVDKTIYQITRGSTKPDLFLVAGKKIQFRIDKDAMFIPDEKGKEVKFRILGASAAGE